MTFLLVYIAEAHPGSIVAVPDSSGATELQIIPPTSTVAERLQNLRQFMELAHLTMPAVVDDEANTAKRLYAGWPDRLYAIGADGAISYKSAPGPTGYKVSELEDWLRANVR